MMRHLRQEDVDLLRQARIEIGNRVFKYKPSLKGKRKENVIIIAKYPTNDIFLRANIDEINRTYTYKCYTATFVLCRKVLENLLVHILKEKYPLSTREHREKYFDFSRRRCHNLSVLLQNLRKSAVDFSPHVNLVERICQLASEFKEKANEMTHSLYHIATKKEIDDKNFQGILNLIQELEKKMR